MIREVARAGYGSIEEVNAALARGALAYNAAPQPELGGLSPNEMGQLLDGDWKSKGALRVDEQLTAGDLSGAAFLADARMLLEFVAGEGTVKETAAGNLNRKTVATVIERMRLPAPQPPDAESGKPSPINEGDLIWLPALRYTLLFARLLVRRKGLRVTPLGRQLMALARTGELYALLFRTLFRTFDLRGLSNSDRHPGLQSTIAWSFYRLRSVAREWSPSEAIAEEAWLDVGRDPPTEYEVTHDFDLSHYDFRQRVLDPLVQFGLLEERRTPIDQDWRELREFRLTPLFDRFVRFEFEKPPARPFLIR